ncbi:MAG: SRPBCC family protein [Ktedonobacterales bacterium]|nr:SRPBCC family protein [Ktedonobacterales bacterium]
MEIKGTHTFTANPQAVWDALHNSAMLRSSIPGAQEVAWQGDNAINVRANVGIGPMSREFMGTLPVTEHTPPSHMKIEVHRNLVAGFCVIDLAPNGAGTLLSYNANLDISGPMGVMAGAARPMVDQQLNQFFTRLEQQIH